MFKIMSARQAAELSPDGACVAVNSFLALANPDALHRAIADRFSESGHPAGLELFCASGFGGWREDLFADRYVSLGAVRKVIASHFSSMPAVTRMARDNEIECYCMPLGVLSHTIRAAASGKPFYLTQVGLNLFVDPRVEGPGMNRRSTDRPVKVVTVDGEEYLQYRTPQIDIALIKGSSVDPSGNITFENENVIVDALAMAQAAKNNGGKVIVQVSRVSHVFSRPRNVIIPGTLVDAVVVSDELPDIQHPSPVLSGDIHVPPSQMDHWMSKLSPSGKRGEPSVDKTADIIGLRAARELCAGDIVNIGIGMPETVGKYASELGILKDVTLTVEAGGTGGLPAPGVSFGSTIGADMISDMATQFDFYDGGGLDICFMGGVEVDRHGNVNAHRIGDRFVGIGGFANITTAAKTIVFCLSFTAKGLTVIQEGPSVRIASEGAVPKFRDTIQTISFSARNALARGQRVLYITERCVFALTENGLALAEVYEGISREQQIAGLLDFQLPG